MLPLRLEAFILKVFVMIRLRGMKQKNLFSKRGGIVLAKIGQREFYIKTKKNLKLKKYY